MLSKRILLTRLLSYLLVLFIVSIPTVLIYKITVSGQEFSISYLILLMFLTFPIYSYIFKLQILEIFFKKNIFILLFLIIYSILLAIYKGVDINFMKFMLFFFFSCLIGYKYYYIFTSFKFVNLFIKLSIILSLFGIVLYYLKLPLFDFKTAGTDLYFMNSDGYYRAMSIFLNPNSFGYFLVFSISLLLMHKKFISKFTYYTYSLIMFFAMYLTYSRSATLSLLLILLIYFIRHIFKKQTSIFIIIMMLTSLVVMSIVLLINLQFFYFYNVRFEKWNVAFTFLNNLEYFLIGTPIDMKIIKNSISFSDNMFIYLILKEGFLFLLLFLFLFYKITIKSIKIFLRENSYFSGYAIYIISLFIPMMFSNYLLFYPSSILTAISIGIISKYRTKVIS